MQHRTGSGVRVRTRRGSLGSSAGGEQALHICQAGVSQGCLGRRRQALQEAGQGGCSQLLNLQAPAGECLDARARPGTDAGMCGTKAFSVPAEVACDCCALHHPCCLTGPDVLLALNVCNRALLTAARGAPLDAEILACHQGFCFGQLGCEFQQPCPRNGAVCTSCAAIKGSSSSSSRRQQCRWQGMTCTLYWHQWPDASTAASTHGASAHGLGSWD